MSQIVAADAAMAEGPERMSVKRGYARGRETRQRILETAIEAFGEAGFDGASTRVIASRAGVNLGLLTYYFGNKEGLYRACAEYVVHSVETETNPMWEPVERALADRTLSPADLLEVMRQLFEAASAWVMIQHAPATWINFTARETAQPGPAQQTIDDGPVGHALHLLATLIGRICGRPADAPDIVIRAGSMIGYFINFDRMRGLTLKELGWDELTDERVDLVKSVIWDQIAAGLTTAPPRPSTQPVTGSRKRSKGKPVGD